MKSFNLSLLALLSLIIATNAVRMTAMSSSSSNDDDYWTGLCLDSAILQSPINILPPFTYIDFDATFSFYEQQEGSLVNVGGHYLKMEGDFGYFDYKDTYFNAYMLHFISPSEHTIGTNYKKFPLELQIYAQSKDGLQINVAILFSTSTDDGDFLSDLGFGDGVLEYLENDQSYQVPKAVDLSKVTPSNNDFFIYQGTNTFPDCEPAIWFVSFETFKISEKQLNDFPKMLLNEGRPQQATQSREIYVTFSETKYEALQSTYAASTTSTSTSTSTSSNSTSTTSDTTVSTSKNELYDAFTIYGGNVIYNTTIYPFASVSNTPRPIRTGDYLVVTNPNTTSALEEFLEINDATVNSAISELEKLNDVSSNNFTKGHKTNISDTVDLDRYSDDDTTTATAEIQKSQKTRFRGKSNKQIVFEPEKRDTNLFFSSYKSSSQKSNEGYSFLSLKSSNELSAKEDVTVQDMITKTSNFFKAVDADAKIATGASSSLSKSSSESIDKPEKQKKTVNKAQKNSETGALSVAKAASEPRPLTDAMIETSALSSTSLKSSETLQVKTEVAQLETDDVNTNSTVNTTNGTLTYTIESDGINVIDTSNWPDFCKLSLMQSPVIIDLNLTFEIEASKLSFNYTSADTTAYSVSNDGYKIVINGSFGEMKYGDHIFEAYSLHLHHPSEHAIGADLVRSDFELQILHYDAFGIGSIVSIFFDSEDELASDFLTGIGLIGNETQSLAVGSTNVVTGLNLLELVEESEHYISYEGSITSPPCSDRVKWFILNKKNSCSTSQVESFATFFGAESNIRPIQSLNNRQFSLF